MRQNFIFIWIFRFFGLLFFYLLTGCDTKTVLEPNKFKQLEEDVYEDFYLDKSTIVFDDQSIQDSLSLINYYQRPVNWNFTQYPDWITFSESSGKIAAKGKKVILIHLNREKIKDGLYARIKINTDVMQTELYVGYFIKKPITPHIREKAEQFIISRVGSDFFLKNIQFNEELSRFNSPHLKCLFNPESYPAFLAFPYFIMNYDFKIPEKSFVNGSIEFAMDTLGNIIEAREVTGLPDCIQNPVECSFNIDEAQAKLIAQNAGFETGLKPWRISFYWYALEFQTYIWSVTNTLYENSAGFDNYKAGGKILLIDANTGDILALHSWVARS